MAPWTRKRVLITVRTYPTPARKGVEVSCTAGITNNGEWIRLYPIPYRSLDDDKQFSKYQWIDVDVAKTRNDSRPESYTPNLDSIKIQESVSPKHEWQQRWQIVRPLLRPSLCRIQQERDDNNSPTLGFFKPRTIDRLEIENTDPDWSPSQQSKLNQTLSMFDRAPAGLLEKIPFNFKYVFHCEIDDCNGHSLSCIDWEMGQSYRKWKREYGYDWERVFRQKYEMEMIDRFDTHFFVGDIHQFPNAWIICGIFYPPKRDMDDLFANNN